MSIKCILKPTDFSVMTK